MEETSYNFIWPVPASSYQDPPLAAPQQLGRAAPSIWPMEATALEPHQYSVQDSGFTGSVTGPHFREPGYMDSERHPPNLQHTIHGPGALPEQDPETLTEAYHSQLTNVLFSLRAYRGKVVADHEGREDVFLLVSTFLDITRASKWSGSLPGVEGSGSTSSPSMLLVTSIIPLAVEIYHASRAAFTMCGGEAGLSSTHDGLQLYTDAIAMEFHLRELKEALYSTQLVQLDTRTIQLLDDTRTTVLSFAQEWESRNGKKRLNASN